MPRKAVKKRARKVTRTTNRIPKTIAAPVGDCDCSYGPPTRSSFAVLFLRCAFGALFLWTGVKHVLDIPGTTAHFAGLGLWGWLGPVLGAAEVAGGAILLLGFWTRTASSAIAILFLVTLIFDASQNGFSSLLFVPLIGLAASLILATTGPGMWALDVPACRCEGSCRW